ncbi:unnamed protein product [Cochlearia groenlandica]
MTTKNLTGDSRIPSLTTNHGLTVSKVSDPLILGIIAEGVRSRFSSLNGRMEALEAVVAVQEAQIEKLVAVAEALRSLSVNVAESSIDHNHHLEKSDLFSENQRRLQDYFDLL